jgi:hypothetical protein
MALHGPLAGERGRATTASKCTLSSLVTAAVLPGNPAPGSPALDHAGVRLLSGFMPPVCKPG